MSTEATIYECPDSPEMNGETITKHFHVSGTSNYGTARGLVLATAPGMYEARYRNEPDISPQWVDDTTEDIGSGELGEGLWDVHVNYTKATGIAEVESLIGTVRIRGAIQEQMTHVTTSRQTVGAYGTGAATDDFDQMINVTQDGPQGVDIPVPASFFSVSKIFSFASAPLFAAVNGCACRTNDASITITDSVTGQSITCAAGELRLRGFTWGEVRADDGIEYVYDFAALPNTTDEKIGSLTGIAKKGHEYLWPRYKKTKHATLPFMVHEVTAAYVERLFKTADYSLLGL